MGSSDRPFLIVAATGRELDAGFGGFGLKMPAGQDKASAKIAGRQADFLVTGVGLVASAMNLASHLACNNDYRGVLNVGIAGSYDLDKLPMGAASVAEFENWPEYGLETETGISAKKLGFPMFTQNGNKVWNRIELAPIVSANKLGLNLPQDIQAAGFNSVNTIAASIKKAQKVGQGANALAENMEGFALALACKKFHLPFLEVRSISNLAGTREKSFWNVPLAFKSLAKAMAGVLGL